MKKSSILPGLIPMIRASALNKDALGVLFIVEISHECTNMDCCAKIYTQFIRLIHIIRGKNIIVAGN